MYMEAKTIYSKSTLQEAYIKHVLKLGERPKSVYRFSKQLGISDDVFLAHYPNLRSLESDIWTGFFAATKKDLEEQGHYAAYSAREKLLAFYYTLQEVLLPYRQFIQLTLPSTPFLLSLNPKLLQPFHAAFAQHTAVLIQEGIGNYEIEQRMFITNKYVDLLWNQALFVIYYWLRDTSKDGERSDVFIEKSTNLAFDLMAKTPLDSAFDLIKFLFLNR